MRADCDEDAARLKRAFSDCERDCDYDGDFAMTGDATRDAPSVKRHDGETAQGAVLNSFAVFSPRQETDASGRDESFCFSI